MAIRPTRAAGRLTATQINRVAKISQFDVSNPSPDLLTLIKRELDTLDQLEVADNPTFVSRKALITDERVRRAIYGGNCDRLRYRYFLYGLDTATLQTVLTQLFLANYSKVTSWLRLSASTPVAGEWATVNDVFSPASSAAQPGANRKPAVGTSSNGLLTATYDGTDMLVVPCTAQNTATDKWEVHGHWRLPDVTTAIQRLVSMDVSAGCSVNRFRLFTNLTNGKLVAQVFINNTDGRQFACPVSFPPNVHTHVRVSYDKDAATDALKLQIWINGVLQTLAITNIGAGGALGALLAVTGTWLIGAASNSDAPTSPLLNGSQHGPNIQIASSILTTGEATSLRNIEVPL